jgi:hypothetical protein
MIPTRFVIMCSGGVLVTMTVVATLTIHAQDTVPQAIVACIGADRVFRLGAIDRSCAQGEQRYVLAPAKPEMEEPKVVNSDNPAQPKMPSEARIAALEDQVRQLQRELVKALELASNPLPKVKAPFEVVDEKGVAIVRVTSATNGVRGLRVFNDTGAQVAVMNNIGDGGLVKVMRNGTESQAVSIVAWDEGALLTIKEGGTARGLFGRLPSGRIAAWVNNAAGKQIVAIGESPVVPGAGAFRVFNAGGGAAVSIDALANGGAVNVFAPQRTKPSAALTLESDGRGVLAIYNATGNAAAALTEHTSFAGAGRVYVNDPQGNWVFAAGQTERGGSACVNDRFGLKCLGIGLPGTGR